MSIFICPKCGHEDLPVWKASKWRRYSLYCHTDELIEFRLDLVEKLRKTPWVFELPFWYKITKNGKIIYRMTQMGKDEFQVHGFTEKPKDPFQRKLLEVTE